jgi:hypothetical protein
MNVSVEVVGASKVVGKKERTEKVHKTVRIGHTIFLTLDKFHQNIQILFEIFLKNCITKC